MSTRVAAREVDARLAPPALELAARSARAPDELAPRATARRGDAGRLPWTCEVGVDVRGPITAGWASSGRW